MCKSSSEDVSFEDKIYQRVLTYFTHRIERQIKRELKETKEEDIEDLKDKLAALLYYAAHQYNGKNRKEVSEEVEQEMNLFVAGFHSKELTTIMVNAAKESFFAYTDQLEDYY